MNVVASSKINRDTVLVSLDKAISEYTLAESPKAKKVKKALKNKAIIDSQANYKNEQNLTEGVLELSLDLQNKSTEEEIVNKKMDLAVIKSAVQSKNEAKKTKKVEKKVKAKEEVKLPKVKVAKQKNKIVEDKHPRAKKGKKESQNSLNSWVILYKKQVVNAFIVMIMFTFVSLSSYVAYAYVASQTSDVVANVSKHLILPTGETPKIYIIQSEKAEMFQNPLFKGIMLGDNVLTYPNAGKVVIYRSSEDKIVNIVNISQ